MYKEIDTFAILDVVNELNIHYRERDGRHQLEFCPYCENEGTKEPYKNFSIDVNSGQFNCWRKNKCGATGNIITLKRDFNIGDEDYDRKKWEKPKPIAKPEETNLQKFYKWYHKERGINPDTLEAFNVGYYEQQDMTYIVYPMIRGGQVINRKYRGVTDKKKMWTEKDCERDFYGQHTINPNSKDVFVTEGEDDCHALYQYGFKTNVLSVPFGASTYTPSMNDTLQQFENIYLVFDDDAAGDKGAENFAKKAGIDRCKRIRLPHKDARACLQEGVTTEEFLEYMMVHEQMEHEYIGSSFVDAGWEMINYYKPENEGTNVTYTHYKAFDNLMRGAGKGEVIVLTGNTGEGKTTFGYNLLHKWELQQQNVMAFSFENQQRQITKKILDVTTGVAAFEWDDSESRLIQRQSDKWIIDQCKSLEAGGWHFYKRKKSDRGNMNTKKLRAIVEDAVKYYGVEKLLIDHFHYLGDHATDNQTAMLDAQMREIKMIALDYDVTIVLVAHPQKVGADRTGKQYKVGLDHGKGTSSISQEADHFMVIEKTCEGWSEVRVLKGREEGKLGSVFFNLDTNFNRFVEAYENIPDDVLFQIESNKDEPELPDFYQR